MMMNRENVSRVVMCGVIGLGLLSGACKKEVEAPLEDEPVIVPGSEVVTPEVIEPEPVVEPEPVIEEEAAEIDQALYINALYETTCVAARVMEVGRQKEIRDEIYARYGFTEESFTAAREQMKGDASLEQALKVRMEQCTSAEIAEGYAKAGQAAMAADMGVDMEEEKEEEKVKRPSRKYSTSGAYTQRGIRSGTFNQGELRLTFAANKRASGQFTIKADGVLVNIPLSGSISDDGAFSMSGSRGANNSLRVSGTATTKSASGSMSGKVNATAFNASVNAQR